jgi:hypothetical protein
LELGIFAADPEDALPDCLGFESTNSMVGRSSEAFAATMAVPHDEQNRPASDTCEPHDTHVDINFSALQFTPWSALTPIATGNANGKVTLQPFTHPSPETDKMS